MNESVVRIGAALFVAAMIVVGIGFALVQQGGDAAPIALAEELVEDQQGLEPNCAPLFDARGALIFELDESTSSGANVGEPVSATDPEGGTVSYALVGSGKDAFSLDSESGQLTTKDGVEFDHDAKPSYSMFVVATDEDGEASCVAVLVSVVDNSYTHVHEEKRTVCRRTRVDGGCDRRFRPLTTTITVTTCATHRHDGTHPPHSTGPCH